MRALARARAPGASMLTLTVAIADARARGDVRTAETLGARRREEIIAADAELRDAMLRAGRIVSLNGASAGETHEAWRQAFAMAAARGYRSVRGGDDGVGRGAKGETQAR